MEAIVVVEGISDKRQSWDEFFIDLAWHIATRSKDPSTKVGAIIIGPNHDIRATGYNGFPRKVNDDPVRYADRELKLKLTIHAEINAIINAARHGVGVADCIMYCTMPPCSSCSTAIIQAGITELVVPTLVTVERWQRDLDIARTMFKEASVVIRLPHNSEV